MAEANSNSFESEKSNDTGERVDFESENDEEEEVEYEEVEEIEEVEEVEEMEEEKEEEEDPEEIEEEEEEEDKSINLNNVEDDEEKYVHAKLLALPPHGSEVYIGGIQQDVTEEDLKEFAESIGEVVEVRIMKGKDSNANKGFAFVNFSNVDLASKAIQNLNNSALKGRRIKCSESQAKHRLFIGNIPRSWDDEDLQKAVDNVGPGVTAVELVKDTKNPGSNRGFAFIDYYNHKCAEYSRQKMSNPTFKLDDNSPTVSWAEQKSGESSPASQVKSLYVKNLPKDITQEKLKQLFEHHGRITKVVVPPIKAGQEKNRIGFVHFADRSSAVNALKKTETYEIDGKMLECAFAKPQVDPKTGGSGSNSHQPGLLSTYQPRGGGYGGFVAGNHGVLGAGYAAPTFAQPMLYGRGPGSGGGGMAMMPMLLPDGRIGYVLQQPGSLPQTPPSQRSVRSGGGSRSNRGRQNGSDGGSGRRYRPY
jgi:heterogeneous nuclear ribonucleoprotein R